MPLRHAVFNSLGFVVALVALSGATATAAQPGPVVFSELMWSGSGASSADEWIELYNRTAEVVDLSGWTITRGEGADEQVMLVIETGTLPPGATFLIANYDQEDDRSHLAAVPALVDAAISLPNSKLRLRLYDGPPETGRVVDEADDGRGVPLAGTGGPDHAAMVRVAYELAGDQPEAWTTAVAADGWDPGAAELGTPGSVPGTAAPEAGGATNVAAFSWARIKAGRR